MTKESLNTDNLLQFIFTDTGFYAETTNLSLSDTDAQWRTAFDRNCYDALFQFSFERKTK
ncbi:hypothetical protein BN3456_01758 [Clostridium sp. C105KSO13]|nr:hypothetical protein BN3456_01758 [Clostridium sp. C105KSO13]